MSIFFYLYKSPPPYLGVRSDAFSSFDILYLSFLNLYGHNLM